MEKILLTIGKLKKLEKLEGCTKKRKKKPSKNKMQSTNPKIKRK